MASLSIPAGVPSEHLFARVGRAGSGQTTAEAAVRSDAEAPPGAARAGWRARLNPQQLDAASHEGGPLLVIAGAGTGKTTTLAARVAHLIESGTPPERILLLTFSRRAAAEMLSRARSMTRDSTARRVWGGTFHATAVRLLRLHGRAV